MELMKQVFSKENIYAAYKAVWQNQGSAGVDGKDLAATRFYLTRYWEGVKISLLSGNYLPKAVLGVNIDKENGGKRQLGIPTVTDRLIQQAIHQVLNRMWDKDFSRFSYGFRPDKNAGMAVRQARAYINSGYSRESSFGGKPSQE